MTSNVQKWVHGLGSATIGGAASALTAQMGLVGAQSAGVDVSPLNFKALGIVAISAGIFSAAMYLKQSPLPAEETTTTTTATVSTTTTVQPEPPKEP